MFGSIARGRGWLFSQGKCPGFSQGIEVFKGAGGQYDILFLGTFKYHHGGLGR